MSPAPTVLGKIIPFAPFDETGVSPGLVAIVTYARERAGNLVAGLSAKRTQILANPDLTDEARERHLGQALASVGVDLASTSEDARKKATQARNNVSGQINETLYGGISPQEVAPARAALASHAQSGGMKIAEVVTDSEGRAMLGASGDIHKAIQHTVEKAPIRQAALAVAALAQADPFTLTLLGGAPVVDAARLLLETRAAAENPDLAALVASRDAADRVLSVVKGDASSAYAAAHRAALGRPPTSGGARPAVS
jgi:hypothetical protein